MQHLPTYVYLIFLILLYVGIKRCFTRTIRIERLLITPLIFLFLSIRGCIAMFALTPIVLACWITGGWVGIGLGYLQARHSIIKSDHSKKLITIPGDISIFLLMLGIFIIEFFVHYAIERHLSFVGSVAFEGISSFLLGAIAGSSIGRNGTYFYKYRSSQCTTPKYRCH